MTIVGKEFGCVVQPLVHLLVIQKGIKNGSKGARDVYKRQASGTSGSSESSSAEVSGQPEAGTESASSQESTASGSSAASSAPSSGAEKESAYLCLLYTSRT